MVDKLLMGRKILRSGTSIPGFLRSGVTCAIFMIDGNFLAAKDELARKEIIHENSHTHD